MTEYRIIARFTSTDPRDAGAFHERTLGRSEDGRRLKLLAERLTAHSAAARLAFHRGPANRPFEHRHASMEPYEALVKEWFDVSLKGDALTFHVAEMPDIPVVDLSKLAAETGVPA